VSLWPQRDSRSTFAPKQAAKKHMFSEPQNPTRCEPLIDADRAAELLKLHPKTVKRLAQAGELPGMKIGRVWRFRESSLDAWMSVRLKCCGHPSPREEALQ
jgi:excisionase family DNA binding protein